MKRLIQGFAALAAVLLVAGCVVGEPTGHPGPGAMTRESGSDTVALRMSDTLGAPVPSLTVSGTWAVHQVNKNGDVFRGTISLVQIGRLLIGHADWANHPDGHLLGYITQNKVVFGQGFTDTSKANLVGLYTARAAVGGDTLVDGLTVSSEGDSGTWVATRIAQCPAVQLTPVPLPCQQSIDTVRVIDTTMFIDTMPPPPPLVHRLSGCWQVNQVALSGVYDGLFHLQVNGDTVTGSGVWQNHAPGTIHGVVIAPLDSTLGGPASEWALHFVQSFASRPSLLGRYEARLSANRDTLRGTTSSTQNGIATGDSGTWTARRASCVPPI